MPLIHLMRFMVHRRWLLGVCLMLIGPREGAAQIRFAYRWNAPVHVNAAPPTAFSPDGRMMAIVNRQRRALDLWDLGERAIVGVLRHPEGDVDVYLNHFCFLGDGSALAASFIDLRRTRSNQIIVYDVARRIPRAFISLERNTFVHRMASSPDGARIAVSLLVPQTRPINGDRGTTRGEAVIYGSDGREIKRLDVSQLCSDVAFAPDGKCVATVHGLSREKGQVLLWDAATLERRSTLRADAWNVKLTFSPDSKLLAAGAERQASKSGNLSADARLWDVATGKDRGRLEGYAVGPNAGAMAYQAFAPRANILAVSCRRPMPAAGQIRLWNAATGEQTLLDQSMPLQALNTGYIGVEHLAFSANGAVLATVALTGRPGVQLWNTRYWRPTRRLELPDQEPAAPQWAAPRESAPFAAVRCIEFGPDGKWLAVERTEKPTKEGEILLWNIEDAGDGTSESPAGRDEE